MKYEGVLADPAGNITLFILSPVIAQNRPVLARALMGNSRFATVEQVGFVIPPEGPPGGDELPRLEMMGGEFCGNAARSFGLLIARERGMTGKGELEIGISGVGRPLRARFDLDTGTASVEIPPPIARRELRFRDRSLAIYDFEGISHVIAPDISPERVFFDEIKGIFEEDRRRQGFVLPDALGVMFYVAERMMPAVYVYGAGSLVFETSCGSGSAAMGLYRGESVRDGRAEYAVAQGGGLIQVTLEKRDDKVESLSIGGPVTLSGILTFDV